MTTGKKNKIIRNISLSLIIVGFFIPWISMPDIQLNGFDIALLDGVLAFNCARLHLIFIIAVGILISNNINQIGKKTNRVL